jgi:WD40 repeat protein
MLASADGAGTIRLWDVSFREAAKWNAAVAEQKDEKPYVPGAIVEALAFAPDGKSLAGTRTDGSLVLWEVPSGKQLRVIEAHQDGDPTGWLPVAFSVDGKIVATGGDDSLVKLWDAATGRRLAILKGHDGAISGVAFSPDNRLLASASRDKTARVWNVADSLAAWQAKPHPEWDLETYFRYWTPVKQR